MGWAVGTDRFVIKRYRVISLFDLGFRRVLGPQFFTKGRKALSIRRFKVVLVTEVPVKAQPLPIVRTVFSGNALAFQPGVVQTIKRRRDGKRGMISRNGIICRFAMIG